VKVLVFHGYLLRGTGSNVYNASLAQALVGLGHEVHLLCQDRGAATLPWVDRVGRWEDGELRVEPAEGKSGSAAGPGTVTAYLPEIGGMLPVYVFDHYEGFSVKTFAELSEAELDAYLEANVEATRDVIASAGGVDAALANHLVMGPLILARAGVPFAAKVHGSALEFTVRPNPRFLPHAEEGMRSAAAVLVGSRHTAESLWETLPDLDLPAKTRLGPPGVDTALFAPAPLPEALSGVRGLAEAISTRERSAGWGQDSAAAAAALERWAAARGPRVLFVGKLIGTKGLDLLLAAWPLVRRANPDARLLVVAFGEGREAFESLLAALDAGDLVAAREIADRGIVSVDAELIPLRMLGSFLSEAPAGYADAARAAAGSILFAGGLDHDEVARVMPAADALVFPSTFPEAFGMVGAEAAASGVLPVSADHSGAREVSRALAPSLPGEARELLSFPLGDGAVEAIADRLTRWLALDPDLRSRAGAALAARAHELWGWESVARGVLAASEGRVEELPAVPEPER
jgi:glycosyltransferase involved in cell wall biosynthesis